MLEALSAFSVLTYVALITSCKTPIPLRVVASKTEMPLLKRGAGALLITGGRSKWSGGDAASPEKGGTMISGRPDEAVPILMPTAVSVDFDLG